MQSELIEDLLDVSRIVNSIGRSDGGRHCRHRLRGPPQVVWNLLSNAVKFTPNEGRVQIRLERVDSRVEIAIIDTGSGISEEVLPYVFDRFQQADSTSSRRHGGLGLGLALVKHLVELHGGTVRAQSDGTGHGSTFIVALPSKSQLAVQ